MASADPPRNRLRLKKMLPSFGRMDLSPDFKLSRLNASKIFISISTLVIKPREFCRLTFLITIGTSMPSIGVRVGVDVGGGEVGVEVGIGVAVGMGVCVRVGNSVGIMVAVGDGAAVGLAVIDETSTQALLASIIRTTSKFI